MPVSPGVSADWAQFSVPNAAPVFTGMSNMFATMGMAMASVQSGNQQMVLDQQRLDMESRAQTHRETMDVMKANAEDAKARYTQGIEALRVGLEVEKNKIELQRAQSQVDSMLGQENMRSTLPGIQSMFDTATFADDYFGMTLAVEQLEKDPNFKYSPEAAQALVGMRKVMATTREINSQETIETLAKASKDGDLKARVRLLPAGLDAATAAATLHQDPEVAQKYTPAELEDVVKATRSYKAFDMEQAQEYRIRKAAIITDYDAQIAQASRAFGPDDPYMTDLELKKSLAIDKLAWEVRNPGKPYRPGIDSSDPTKRAVTADTVLRDGSNVGKLLLEKQALDLSSTLLEQPNAPVLMGLAKELYGDAAISDPRSAYLQASLNPKLPAETRQAFKEAVVYGDGPMDPAAYERLRASTDTILYVRGSSNQEKRAYDPARDLAIPYVAASTGRGSMATASRWDEWNLARETAAQAIQIQNQEYAAAVTQFQTAVQQPKTSPAWGSGVTTSLNVLMSSHQKFTDTLRRAGMPADTINSLYPSPQKALVDEAWWKYYQMRLTNATAPATSAGSLGPSPTAAGPTGREPKSGLPM